MTTIAELTTRSLEVILSSGGQPGRVWIWRSGAACR